MKNGGRNLGLFELGRVFAPAERVSLSVLLTGCTDGTSEADFFTMKGVVETALGNQEWTGTSDPRFHPTRQAGVAGLGLFGQIHPLVAERCDLMPATFLAEFDLDAWLATGEHDERFRPLSRHPAVRRDIAIEVPKSVPFRDIEAKVVQAGGHDLEAHWLFDVYEGPGVSEGAQSLAIALLFRKDGNFTDEEANRARDGIVEALQGLGARLR